MFENFIDLLREHLNRELPGPNAQQKMVPYYEDVKRQYEQRGTPSKKGSVLLLLYPENNEIKIPLMQRPDYDGVHSGQISFPGGKKEEGDEDLIATALREAREEIGILEKDVKVLGKLSELFIPASNFTVLPIVGYVEKRPYFLADPYEVVKIIETNIDELLNDACVKIKKMKLFNGLDINTPYYDIQGHVVWGATAMMLSEFLHIVQNIKRALKF